MKLIVGLGNPGPQYELTRHNIGFIVLDFFAEFLKTKFKEGKGEWLEAKGNLDDEDIFLLKPLTYMNKSGTAVSEFIEKYSVEVKDVLILVDDFQIPLGMIRVRKEGSDGGHNGLSSIIYSLNSDKFPRMRIGIGKNEVLRKDDFTDYVLEIFSKEEIKAIKKMMPVYFECIESFIKEGITKTMNSFNKMYF